MLLLNSHLTEWLKIEIEGGIPILKRGSPIRGQWLPGVTLSIGMKACKFHMLSAKNETAMHEFGQLRIGLGQ